MGVLGCLGWELCPLWLLECRVHSEWLAGHGCGQHRSVTFPAGVAWFFALLDSSPMACGPLQTALRWGVMLAQPQPKCWAHLPCSWSAQAQHLLWSLAMTRGNVCPWARDLMERRAAHSTLGAMTPHQGALAGDDLERRGRWEPGRLKGEGIPRQAAERTGRRLPEEPSGWVLS